MKIVDCFVFYNELRLLSYRLSVLAPYVDYFVIVEAGYTHAGRPKQLYYAENAASFQSFHPKIVHVVLQDLPHKHPDIDFARREQWINENFQRNGIREGIGRLGLDGEDVVLISDLDEIPDPVLLQKIRGGHIRIVEPHRLEQDFYYYDFRCYKGKWYYSVITPYEQCRETSPQEHRNNAMINAYPTIERAGWHLSFFGDPDFIRNKIRSYTHQEYNTDEFTDEKKIQERLEHKKDIFDRDEVITIIPEKENTYLPPDFLALQPEKWSSAAT